MGTKKSKRVEPAPDTAPEPAPEPAPGSPDVVGSDPLAAAQAQAAEYLALAQTVQAEFLNYRKRVAREKDDVRLAAARDWASALLPVLDQLQMALAAEGDAATIREGVTMTAQGFEQALAQLGVEAIAAVGVPFDPDQHEAIAMVPTAEAAAGVIVAEVQRGFSFQGRVLRAPRVLVAAALPAPGDGGGGGDDREEA